MTDCTIHNLTYFLTELDKNLSEMEVNLEKEYITLQSLHILSSTMNKMCKNWENKEKFQNQEQ